MKFILRHWYAGLAMHAILHRKGGYDSMSGEVGVGDTGDLVYESYKYGDAMARGEHDGPPTRK